MTTILLSGIELLGLWIWTNHLSFSGVRRVLRPVELPTVFRVRPLTLPIILTLVAIILIFRNLALDHPFVFGDEGIYTILAKFAGREDLLGANQLVFVLPSSLYLHVYHSVFWLGADYLQGARFLNVIFFSGALIILYGLLRLFVSSSRAVLCITVIALTPLNIYVVLFMPESMYACTFYLFVYVYIRYIYERPLTAAFVGGIILGTAALIKPHAFMFVPITILATVLFMVSHRDLYSSNSIWRFVVGFLLSLGISYMGLMYVTTGSVGLSLGGAYGDLVHQSIQKSPVSAVLYVFRGHIATLTSLFALPLITIVCIAFSRASGDRSTKDVELKALVLFTLCALVILSFATSKFTVSILGKSIFDQPNRLHARYYSFVLPLLLVCFVASHERLNWASARFRKVFVIVCLIVAALSAYCILVVDKQYFMYFVDFPDAYGLVNDPIVRWLVLAITCASLIYYGLKPRTAAAVFIAGFGLLSVVGSYWVSVFLLDQPRNPTDEACALFRELIPKQQLNAGTIVVTQKGDADLYRLLFYLPGAYELIIDTAETPLTSTAISAERAWVLVTSARPVSFPFTSSYSSGRYHLYLRRPGPSNQVILSQSENAQPTPIPRSVFTGACAPSQLVGFENLEPWGIWSSVDNAGVRLSAEASGRLKMHFVGFVAEPSARLNIQVSNVSRSVELSTLPKQFYLDFALTGPSREIVLSGIQPKSPKSMGNSSGRQAFRRSSGEDGLYSPLACVLGGSP